MAQILLGESISLSSVTFGMALINLIPATTFALAIAFRLDSLRMWTVSGRAKLFGIVLGLSGGMLFTFYRGPRINTWSTYLDLLHLEKLQNNQEVVLPRKVGVQFFAVLPRCPKGINVNTPVWLLYLQWRQSRPSSLPCASIVRTIASGGWDGMLDS
ncbi:hypothetical protein D5086_000443 [Populus alba]|uniref:Uncharacterized protein n=1 Tax=Populus alba TaxID=43335 RepID=A0ACC4CX34_POPAL